MTGVQTCALPISMVDWRDGRRVEGCRKGAMVVRVVVEAVLALAPVLVAVLELAPVLVEVSEVGGLVTEESLRWWGSWLG